MTAQSVLPTLPEAVSEAPDMDENNEPLETTHLVMRMTDTIPVLVSAIQELKTRLEALETP